MNRHVRATTRSAIAMKVGQMLELLPDRHRWVPADGIQIISEGLLLKIKRRSRLQRTPGRHGLTQHRERKCPCVQCLMRRRDRRPESSASRTTLRAPPAREPRRALLRQLCTLIARANLTVMGEAR